MKKRDSKFELLRLAIMFGIVVGHYLCHGGVLNKGNLCNRIVSGIMSIYGGKTSNLIFVMISAWFLSDREELHSINNKTILLVIRCMVFSIGGYLASVLISGECISIGMLYKSFATSISGYGFLMCYILMLTVAPVLNIILNKMSKEILETLIFSALVFTLLSKLAYDVQAIVIFTEIYLLIGYIKKYAINEINRKTIVVIGIINMLCIIFAEVTGFILNVENPVFMIDNENDITVIVNALFFFLLVVKLPDIYIDNINFVSSGIIYVYLIHENSWIRPLLWEKLKAPLFYNSPFMIIHCLLCSLIVMIVGLTIGMIYGIFENHVVKILLISIEKRMKKYLLE